MRQARYALLGLLLGCATETNANLGDGLGFGGSGGSAGALGTSGSGGQASGGGGMTTGGMSNTSGTTGVAGVGIVGGTFGNPVGGTAGEAPVGGGGAGGAGGDAGAAGGGAGGKGGAGGAGGKGGSGGSGGSGGGMGTVKCGDLAIPAIATWKASASDECAPTCADPNGPFTAALAIDNSVATRYSSGTGQAGDETLQIDLGAQASINRVTINTVPAGDYGRHYQVRASANMAVAGTPVLGDVNGAAGVTTINLSQTVNARYVLISQTGVFLDSWWSINEITVTCQ